jgi:hypothetical protein
VVMGPGFRQDDDVEMPAPVCVHFPHSIGR